MKRTFILVFLSLATLTSGFAQKTSTPGFLPEVFAGWTKSPHLQVSKDPATADPTNAAVLKEDGFTDFEQAEYTQPGRKATVKAIRFADTSGAYSAFTLYRPAEVEALDMGQKNKDSLGFSAGESATFFRQNILVTVTFDRVTPMTPGAVRELATLLPDAKGTARNFPPLPSYLPRTKQAFINNSEKYILGPDALALSGSPIPAQLIGFVPGANVEVSLAKYRTSEGLATLMVVSYPTPAIAGERERTIASFQQNTPPASPDLAPPFNTKRTGPLLVVTAGKISQSDAKSLLASVNYEAEVTWNQNTKLDNYGGFLVSLIALIGVGLALFIVAGFAFGGFRVLMQKLYPGRIFNKPGQTEIIQLNIKD